MSPSKLKKMDKKNHPGRGAQWGKAGTKFKGISFYNGSDRGKFKKASKIEE